jgi:hypothetical protein
MLTDAAPRFAVAALVAGLLLSVSAGCVRRRMTVRTEPPGALVSVDNQIIGTSPVASPFTYYGTREIRVERDGFRTEVLREKLDPPWYQLPVIDFFAETMYPGEFRDERIIDVQLLPNQLPPIDQVRMQANQLRQQARQGVITSSSQVTDQPTMQSLPPSGVPARIPQ